MEVSWDDFLLNLIRKFLWNYILMKNATAPLYLQLFIEYHETKKIELGKIETTELAIIVLIFTCLRNIWLIFACSVS